MTPSRRLTARQKAFVQARHHGATFAAAARAAGYAPGCARQTGSRLAQHPAIVAALERRRAGYTGQPPITDDPRVFLVWCMNDPELLSLRERIGVAEFLMAFTA